MLVSSSHSRPFAASQDNAVQQPNGGSNLHTWRKVYSCFYFPYATVTDAVYRQFVSLGSYHASTVISIFILFWEKHESGCFHGIMGLRVWGFQIPVICGLNSRIPTVGVNRGRELISLCTLSSCASRLRSIIGVPYTFKKRCPWSSLVWF